MKHTYEVVVGNIGIVYRGTGGKSTKVEAYKHFYDYKEQSQNCIGRAAGESVSLFQDGEPYLEHMAESTGTRAHLLARIHARTPPDEVPAFYECGTCGAMHPAVWNGDCREDAARFFPEELDEIFGAFNGWREISAYEATATLIDPDQIRRRQNIHRLVSPHGMCDDYCVEHERDPDVKACR